jgi:hypothetical protein
MIVVGLEQINTVTRITTTFMNQLQLLIRKLKPKETETLAAILKRSRGRSKKRYQLFCFLKEDNPVREHTIIKKLYGDSENSKQNYRKLVQRLEKVILSILEKHNVHVHSIRQMELGILSVQRLNVLLSNNYGDNHIQSEFENMDKQAQNNQLFLNQVLLERAKLESFYLSECPLVSLDKMKSIHELSRYVTEAEVFHMSCKRYYLIEDANWNLLDKTQNSIHEYYIRCNEPIIGFHYHAGSIILNFIKNESVTCSYHIDQLEYLARKTDVLNKGGFNDEFILLKFLCSSLKPNGSSQIRQLLAQDFYSLFKSSKDSLFERVKNKPFELDVLIRLLIIREDFRMALSIINSTTKRGLFRNSEHLTQRLEKYSLIVNTISRNHTAVNLLLNKIQSNRKSSEAMRFYLPMYKFIIHQDQLSGANFLVNLDSFRRNLRRNVTQFNEKDLSVKEIDLLQTIYRFLSNRLSDNPANGIMDHDLLHHLKSDFNVLDIDQIQALVLIKWLENTATTHFNAPKLLSVNKPKVARNSF